MNVLIACEESQEVCKAFRQKGHRAFSCDLQECSGGYPEWHICGDVLQLINGNCAFLLQCGVIDDQCGPWDLIIAHPPCTYLTTASAGRMYHKNTLGESCLVEDRVREMIVSRDLFMAILHTNCEKIVVENPLPMHIACLPKYTQIIEPYQFGDPWTKRTCLWIKGVPALKPTNIVDPINGSWVNGGAAAYRKKGKENIFGKSSAKERSKTFPGIARAMAEQWG